MMKGEAAEDEGMVTWLEKDRERRRGAGQDRWMQRETGCEDEWSTGRLSGTMRDRESRERRRK